MWNQWDATTALLQVVENTDYAVSERVSDTVSTSHESWATRFQLSGRRLAIRKTFCIGPLQKLRRRCQPSAGHPASDHIVYMPAVLAFFIVFKKRTLDSA